MNMVRLYYTAPALRDRIASALAQPGKSEGDLTPDDLSPLDEFHLRGHTATVELIELLGATPGKHILDAGAGLGGPARRLARTTGCRVTGVDLSTDLCDAGAYLNQRTGLTDLVSLVPGDVTDLTAFADNSFNGAWTMHVSMNIRDKAAFYREVARVVSAPAMATSTTPCPGPVMRAQVSWPRPTRQSAGYEVPASRCSKGGIRQTQPPSS